MDACLKEECEQIESDLTLTALGDESIGTGTADNDDEVEEIGKSLKEIVQDQDVKPKLQCIMMDPSFSMVAVQGEDSSIVFEAVSTGSRCTSPKASEASTTSEGYSMVSRGASGQVVVVVDEDKIKRREKSRPNEKSQRSRTPLGENIPGGPERPAMTEVSVPNIRPENGSGNQESTDPNKYKDQTLFSIVSEGSEILNIMVPSKFSTVDEEESLRMVDNLFYLENTPKIKSKQMSEEGQTLESYFELSGECTPQNDEDNSIQVSSKDLQATKEDSLHSFQCSNGTQMRKDATGGMDYLEKFTLMDESSPGEYLSGTEEYVCSKAGGQEEISIKQERPQGLLACEGQDQLAASNDIEIASEYIDEIFYGSSFLDELEIPEEEHEAEEPEQPKSPLKERGSTLFGSQETILDPIFLSPGPPKIIDPVLLEEPVAMSFFYSDLYSEAMGARRKDDEFSEEVESIASERSSPRRLSDVDDALGYLEKFILKDETPVVEGEPVTGRHKRTGLGMSMENPFEIGALIRVQAEVAGEQAKEKLRSLISVLQGGSQNTEAFASELELVYSSIQNYWMDQESPVKKNEETMTKIMDLCNQVSQCMDENKSFKLELIQDQIGTIKKSIESVREALEIDLKKMEATDQTSSTTTLVQGK